MARAYKMSIELRERINQVWYSEKLGRTYSSEKRMRAAEAASERMKGNDIINAIAEKLPISWDNLGQMKNQVSHNDGESIIAELFYNSEGDDWDTLRKENFLEYYDEKGWREDYGDGLTLYNFILYVLPESIFSEEQQKLKDRQNLKRYQVEDL